MTKVRFNPQGGSGWGAWAEAELQLEACQVSLTFEWLSIESREEGAEAVAAQPNLLHSKQ